MPSDVAIPDTFATTAQPSACPSEYRPHRRARVRSCGSIGGQRRQAVRRPPRRANSSCTATPSGGY